MHRTIAAGLLATTLFVVGCGGGPSSDKDDNPQAASTQSSDITADTSTSGATVIDSGDILPDADPATYVGRNRVVNLIVMPDGSTPVVDVWARRSFEYAPILLAEGLDYGEVSDWYGRPDGMSVTTVASGAGPDADEIADVFSAVEGDQSTHLLMWDRESQAASGFLLEEVAAGSSQQFPPADPATGLVQVYAYQLKIHALAQGESFDLSVGGKPVDYAVGIDGTSGCAPQPRITSQGFSASILGGTQRVPLDLPPGTSALSFHGWGSTNADCTDPSIIGPFPITVEAGSRQWMLLHSPDGASIEALILPVD